LTGFWCNTVFLGAERKGGWNGGRKVGLWLILSAKGLLGQLSALLVLVQKDEIYM
jgi:hypothetical protein